MDPIVGRGRRIYRPKLWHENYASQLLANELRMSGFNLSDTWNALGNDSKLPLKVLYDPENKKSNYFSDLSLYLPFGRLVRSATRSSKMLHRNSLEYVTRYYIDALAQEAQRREITQIDVRTLDRMTERFTEKVDAFINNPDHPFTVSSAI